ncbi:aminotransferase [Roseibium sp. TrichSKD4]|nr:aminotransferase [Roseibium sp. TrichSKD4]
MIICLHRLKNSRQKHVVIDRVRLYPRLGNSAGERSGTGAAGYREKGKLNRLLHVPEPCLYAASAAAGPDQSI